MKSNFPMNPHDSLLAKIREKIPELCAEDAFPAPAWFAQQDLWVTDPQNSNSAVYNYPLALRFQGPLQIPALEESLREIVRRHHSLRSVFRFVGGDLVQIVVPPSRVSVPLVDLSYLSEPEKAPRAHKWILEDAGRAFDLASGPLLRAGLLRLGPSDHLLVLTTHHLVCDDWSTGILVRELAALYAACTRNTPAPLPDLRFQYGDFARWLEKQLEGEKLETRISFWRGQLAGGDSFHHLVPDYPLPARRTYRGAEQSRMISEDMVASLRALSQRQRASLFMTLLAAWQCLLHRVSGATQIGVGSCAANRPLAEVEGLIGRFGNDLVLRTDLSGNPTFRELIARVRETALSAYSYQDVPFAELVKRLDSVRDLGRNPLFQIMFIMQDAPKQTCEFPGLSWSWFPSHLGTAKYDLNVWVRIRGRGLEIAFEYNMDLFETGTMSRLLRSYQALLEAVVADPGARVGELPMEGGLRQPALRREQGPRAADDWASATLRKSHAAGGDSPLACQPGGANEFSTETQSVTEKTTSDVIESELLKIWEAAFHKPVTLDDDFFQLGGNSLLAARLFAQVEKRLKISVPLSALFTASTIRGIADILRKQSPDTQWPLLVAVQPRGRRPPLFCAHGVAGHIQYSHLLVGELGSDQPIFGLQSRGLTGLPHLTIPAMARDYVKEIRSMQPRGPYHLLGNCFGGWVAYEVAVQLQAQGQEVAFLGMINAPIPSFLHPSLKKFVNLPAKEKWNHLRRRFVGLKWMVACSNTVAAWRRSELLQGNRGGFLPKWILDIGTINLQAAKKYVPEKYPGRVTLFLSEETHPALTIDAVGGWRALAGAGLEIESLPGRDESALVEPYRLVLGQKLRACLDRAQAASSAMQVVGTT
jgi:thioesterase domain-containing protein/acyl carrier protein